MTLSEQERHAKEFGKERDDFYPTERHVPLKSDPQEQSKDQ